RLDLALSALHDIVNWGTISSSGNLSMSAGNSITNGLPAVAGNTALIQAAGNVNLFTNNLINASNIGSLNGNINIANQTLSNMTINNVYGRLEALQGAINITGKAPAFNLALYGGDVVSKAFNANVGQGDIDINVNKLEGAVNLEALNSHALTETDNLALGNLKIAGDPAFYNSSGNITLTGDLIFSGQPLALVASGNITGNGFKLDTSSSTADGGDLFICAGCTVSPSGSALPPSSPSSVPLTVGGPSAKGGDINLSNYTVTTGSTLAGGNGGDITMIAHKGSVTFSGSMSSGGTGSGANGNVTIVSGDDKGAALEVVGTVDTGSGTGGGGNIQMVTAPPSVSGTVSTSGQFTGTVSWGSISPSANASIGNQQTPTQLKAAGSVTIQAGDIELFRDTKIFTKKSVTLAAINDVVIGDETSGQHPEQIIAGSLTP